MPLYLTTLRLSCHQQHNLALNYVVSIKPRLTLLMVQNHRSTLPLSRGAIRANTTFRLKSFSAVSATLTSTKSVANGVRCPLSTHAFLDMRSSAVSLRSALQSPNSSQATLLPVGCMVDSDGDCLECQDGLEQFCPHVTLTYNSPDAHLGGVTYGGYSDSIVVKEHFVLRVPPNLNLAGAAPLLCAGITTYSPMRHWGVTKGKKVGVVGLGGLGHMAIKFAHALGAHVVVFTTSPSKKEDALRLGADEVIISRDTDQMSKHKGSFDFILDAVSAEHDINSYIRLLRRDGNITVVGAPDKPFAVPAFSLISKRLSLSGSPIGGIAETQEMLDFCGKHNITADVEVIPIQKVNEAYDRLSNADVKYRFSIDMTSLKSQ